MERKKKEKDTRDTYSTRRKNKGIFLKRDGYRERKRENKKEDSDQRRKRRKEEKTSSLGMLIFFLVFKLYSYIHLHCIKEKRTHQ